MPRPAPAKALPAVPGWSRPRIEARLPSPASRSDADKARWWADLERPLDPARLPAVVQTDRPGRARRAGRRVLLGALVLMLLLAAAYLTLWADSPWEEIVPTVVGLPGLLALLGAALLWSVRGQPDTLRLELSTQRVRCGVPPSQWDEPLSAYAGLALRRRLLRDPTRRRDRHFSRAERAAGMDRRVERWWIELVHEDPARTVVLWASDQPLDDGLERVDALAEALGLPILTTSNRYWIADDEVAGPSAAAPGPRAGAGTATPPRGPTVVASASGIPRLLALGVLLPLTVAMGWLSWTVAQQTRAVVQTWQPVQVTVLDKSGGETLRVAIVDAEGQRREADVARTTDLKSFATNESFAAYVDPAQPQVLRPASAASLWGGVGLLAFFTLAFAASGLFLWRTRPLPR